MKYELPFCVIVVLVLSGCATPPREPQVFEYFRKLPIGTPLQRIEADLSLNDPEKTFVGNSLYRHRSFRYQTPDGLFLLIGLKQMTDDDSYKTGVFRFRGHHTIGTDGWSWKKWEYEDGYIDLIWDPDGNQTGLNQIRVSRPDWSGR